MPVILEEHSDNETVFGVWEIQEEFDLLKEGLKLNANEIDELDGFGSHKRKLEWLSVRQLLRTLINENVSIVYNDERKPFLSDKSRNISISHSNNYTSIYVSKKRVGIDLEYMSHNIDYIAHKFIHEDEFIDEHKASIHQYIHWCAKEALYKIVDKQNLNFKQDLFVEPFEPGIEGQIFGHVKWPNMETESFSLFYRIKNNYVIAQCQK